ncbi:MULTISPECIES: glycoside hydrolase family 10 protein [unclassified Ruminococcus]|uniref:glycoside hydrolase family 10 protein n=1 Tax=unclassified Ruminococcus TaxID=2608920 RepID=UPI00210E45B2|nr:MULTISPECIES: family 10 glycosylhydrolase [unclassified Ruminococcus]MCQ4021882.1 family 10 glycosylhydrolase [Ruminococcus sp. zg-924]MCQ4114327.1 family 10 glycosylhydrolase [Ruminococcus sp. zg-921]
MKKNGTAAPLITALAVLICVVGIMWKLNPGNNIAVKNKETSPSSSTAQAKPSNKDEEAVQTSAENKSDEMLAVWVPYMSLMVDDEPSEQAFKDNYDNIVSVAKAHKMNALVVHVRPYGDSMYMSDYFPFSHILTETQGENPGYDAMKYMVEKTHESGLEFHAWINPLRIKVSETPPELSQYSPYSLWQNDDDESNDRYTMEYDGGIYLNPAYEKVREYITGSIKELVSRYDVDGVHFDDYFYPDESEDYDSKEYNSYLNLLESSDNAMSHLEWRTENINSLVSGVYSGIKSVNSKVVFGISPQGNISNDIKMGADIKTWGSISGYCDYLCPQNYFSKSNSTLPYNEAVESWRKLVTNKDIKLYIGLGLYKAGSDADNGTWLDSDENLKEQIEFGRQKGVDGFMFYSFDYLESEQTETEVKNVMNYLEQKTS